MEAQEKLQPCQVRVCGNIDFGLRHELLHSWGGSHVELERVVIWALERDVSRGGVMLRSIRTRVL